MLRLYFGPLKPREIILGQEASGIVEAVGKDVSKFKVGDQVFGANGFSFGGYAEYNCLSEKACYTLKPENISFEEAAGATIGGMEAIHYLKKFKIKKGDQILINGAGGSIGTSVLQIAKHYGAKVTVVDISDKFKMLKSLGADTCIDFRNEDFTKLGNKYDVIFDVVGKSHFSRSLKSLNKKGKYIIANPRGHHKLRGRWVRRLTDKSVYFDTSDYDINDLIFIRDFLTNGHMKIYIDQVLPLDEIPRAHEYVEAGKKEGNLIIKVIE